MTINKIKWLVAGTIVVAFSAPGISEILDQIERTTYPIITNQQIANVKEAGGQLCWDWHFDKKRDVPPTSASWTLSISSSSGNIYFVNMWHNRLPLQSNNLSQIGHNILPLCVDVPSNEYNTITINGKIEYFTMFKLRPSWYKLPPITFDKK